MYLNKTTNQFGISEREIREANPNTSFSTPFSAPEDYAYVFASPKPQYDSLTQSVVEVQPELINGHYEQRWEVKELYKDAKQREAAISDHLEQLKATKREEINQARLAATYSSFFFADKEIDCDALSRSDIDGTNGYVSLFGELPPLFPGGWKTKDNTYVAIPDVDTWKLFYTSMFEAGAMNFAKSQALKAQIDAATTVEQLSTIQW